MRVSELKLEKLGVAEREIQRMTIESRPDKERLLRTAISVLAEEEKLEKLLKEATEDKKKKIEKEFERVRAIRGNLLRIYNAMILRGAISGGWKITPITSKLKEW